MKRSEMLDKIAKVIHEYRRATSGITSNELASMVLDVVEYAGMRPPPVKNWPQHEVPGSGYFWEQE